MFCENRWNIKCLLLHPIYFSINESHFIHQLEVGWNSLMNAERERWEKYVDHWEIIWRIKRIKKNGFHSRKAIFSIFLLVLHKLNLISHEQKVINCTRIIEWMNKENMYDVGWWRGVINWKINLQLYASSN